MKTLFLITARGGSKGIPGKNIKPLAGKPLILYSLEYARIFSNDKNICISTDSDEIIGAVARVGYKVPFIRPENLARDSAGTYDVINHALSFYLDQGIDYDIVVLLQPTSPFREKFHLKEALNLYKEELDMVVSVNESPANPYFNLFEENTDGFLKISKGTGEIKRRQDAPIVYNYNGSLYIINADSIRQKKSFNEFDKVKKYVMSDRYSIDLDTMEDWNYAEFLSSQPVNS